MVQVYFYIDMGDSVKYKILQIIYFCDKKKALAAKLPSFFWKKLQFFSVSVMALYVHKKLADRDTHDNSSF